ncbi:MAG TPA: TCR/Tet family MFS transporter [Kofleriaceae bacterium]|nr:TCR/Tet family MFS transporter [Kofleriaceae bacterium]
MPAVLNRGRPRRAALAFIFVTVLIDILAFGVIIPVLPHLVEQLSGGTTSTAAYWVGAFGTIFALIQFITSPIQGALSDRFGRRPVILFSCLGLGLDFGFMALAPSLAWLLVGRILSAITSASFTTANAYIADVTPPAERAKAFGLLGAAFGVGFIIGPLIGGVLGDIDLRLPFWFAAALAVVNFSYGWFVLPESLPRERRSERFDWSQARPFAAIFLLRRFPQLYGLVAVLFLANLAHYVYPSVFVLFADYRYGWGQREVGYVLAAVGVLSVIVNVVIVGRVVKRMGERRALLFGLAFGTAGFAIYGAAEQGWMFLVGLPVSALWAIAAPASQALITHRVTADVQGRIQGALMSLVSIAGIIAPSIFAGSFGYFVSPDTQVHLPGVPFLIAALILFSALVVAVRYAATSATAPASTTPAP